MATSTKPTFVLVPGTFHTPVHGQPLADALHAKGYPTEAISHPTIGPLATTAPHNADPANLRQVLEKLINDQEKEVILVCHSYGGVPGSQVEGLERSARAKAGHKGGIVKLIYLSALLPLEGESAIQASAAVGHVGGRGGWREMDVGHPYIFSRCCANRAIQTTTGTLVHTFKAAPILYHDLPDDQAEYWASKLQPIASHFNSTPATNVCWDTDVPKVYIFCKQDRAILFEEQQRFLERAQGGRKDSWKTYEMDCGHSPFLSHVEELTEILTKE